MYSVSHFLPSIENQLQNYLIVNEKLIGLPKNVFHDFPLYFVGVSERTGSEKGNGPVTLIPVTLEGHRWYSQSLAS